MSAIDIISLTKSFGNFTAVSDVTMSVKKGEFMGLLGPNGAGKSTMLKVVTGMIKPTSGTVTVNGIDCTDHQNAMKDVGCVIETPECYTDFTPTEIMNYVGRIYGVSKNDMDSRIREVLEEVRMWEWRNNNIGTFSKGMKQRVSIAQALLPDPEILIFDEPTSGLDPRGMIEIREILSGLKGRGKSLLISTHMLKEVSEVCDSVTVIRKGKKVISGNVRDLLRNKAGEVEVEVSVRRDITQEFMTAIANIPEISYANKINEYTFAFRSSGSFEDRECIVDLVREHSLGFLTMNEKGSDLETLYMSLTGGENDDIR